MLHFESFWKAFLNHGITFIDKDFIDSPPRGTVFADKVKLLKRIL